MKKDLQLLQEIGEIDEKYVAEAVEPVKKTARKRTITRVAAIAACLVVAIAAGIAVPRVIRANSGAVADQENNDPAPGVTDTTDATDTTDNNGGGANCLPYYDGPAPDWSVIAQPNVQEDAPSDKPIGGTIPPYIERYYDIRYCTVSVFGKDDADVFTSPANPHYEDVNKVINKYDELMHGDSPTCYHYRIMIWYVVHDLGITRDEFVRYNEALKRHHPDENEWFTDEEVDVIMQDDPAVAHRMMRTKTTLYSEKTDEIIRLEDVKRMTNEQFRSYGFTEDDVREMIDAVTVYYTEMNEDGQKAAPSQRQWEGEKTAEHYAELLKYRAGLIDDTTEGVEFTEGEHIIETKNVDYHGTLREEYKMPENGFELTNVKGYETEMLTCRQVVEYGNEILDALRAGNAISAWEHSDEDYGSYELRRVTLETDPIDYYTHSYVIYDYIDTTGKRPTLHVAAGLGVRGYVMFAWSE